MLYVEELGWFDKYVIAINFKIEKLSFVVMEQRFI